MFDKSITRQLSQVISLVDILQAYWQYVSQTLTLKLSTVVTAISLLEMLSLRYLYIAPSAGVLSDSWRARAPFLCSGKQVKLTTNDRYPLAASGQVHWLVGRFGLHGSRVPCCTEPQVVRLSPGQP